MTNAAVERSAVPYIDTTKRYVRIDHVRADGFVAFDFSIGEPEYYAELLLPQAAFEAFCADNAVTMLDPRNGSEETNEFEWSLRQAAEAAASGNNPGKIDDIWEKN
jgi:phenol hydroxylase P0 protein